MRSSVIVLDACTIINLLRIDDDNHFLFELLLKIAAQDSLFISEEVLEETRNNKFCNVLSDEKKKQINQVLPQLQRFKKENKYIQGYEDIVSFVKEYVNYEKRYNGELSSAILCVLLSMETPKHIAFLTDDYPAKDAFQGLFSFLHFGQIEDTVDFLFFLYKWQPSNKFTKNMLIEFLSKLKIRYAEVQYHVVEEAKKQLVSYSSLSAKKQHKEEIDAFNLIIDGWYKNNMEWFYQGINIIKNMRGRSKVVLPFIDELTYDSYNCQLNKILSRLNEVKKYSAYIFQQD